MPSFTCTLLFFLRCMHLRRHVLKLRVLQVADLPPLMGTSLESVPPNPYCVVYFNGNKLATTAVVKGRGWRDAARWEGGAAAVSVHLPPPGHHALARMRLVVKCYSKTDLQGEGKFLGEVHLSGEELRRPWTQKEDEAAVHSPQAAA